jgi:hypothetical protein
MLTVHSIVIVGSFANAQPSKRCMHARMGGYLDKQCALVVVRAACN